MYEIIVPMDNNSSILPPELNKLIQEKLETFNLRRVSDQGRYYIVLPSDKTLYYTLWFNNPTASFHPNIYLANLELNALSSINKAMRMTVNSFLPLYIKDNIESFVQNGDDIILFGKYRGRHLQDIYAIDSRYVSWIADKYEPHTKSEYRFKELAVNYNKVYLDLQIRRKYKQTSSNFIGIPGDKITNLEVTIIKIRIEDDSYKTRLINGTEFFYVDQLITAIGSAGNLYLFTIKAFNRSLESRTLAPGTHAYQKGDKLLVASAKVIKHIESHNTKYTKLGYIKFKES